MRAKSISSSSPYSSLILGADGRPSGFQLGPRNTTGVHPTAQQCPPICYLPFSSAPLSRDYILWQLAFYPQPRWPELLCSFDFPSLALITGSHLLFLFPRASCFRLAPAGLARPSEGAREAGWDCLSSSAQVGEMSQLARVTVSPRLEPQTVFLEGLAWLPISHYFIYSVRSL